MRWLAWHGLFLVLVLVLLVVVLNGLIPFRCTPRRTNARIIDIAKREHHLVSCSV